MYVFCFFKASADELQLETDVVMHTGLLAYSHCVLVSMLSNRIFPGKKLSGSEQKFVVYVNI